MARQFFTYEVKPEGAILRLVEKPLIGSPKPVAIDDWAARAEDEAFSGVSRVLALLEEGTGKVERREGGIFLDHSTIASLTEPQALSLQLPPAVRVGLQITTKNLITDSDFQISGRWIGEANRVLNGERVGAFLKIDGKQYRIPQTLFDLKEAIDRFAARPAGGDQLAELAELQSLLPEGAQHQLAIDKYLTSFRIYHAAAFSLRLKVEGQAFDFDPVLFGRRVVETAKSEQIPISEAEGLLTPHQQNVFASERFRASSVVKQSYVIERGVYVYLDPALHQAMQVVRRVQGEDAIARKRFAQSPQLYLKEALSTSLADDDVERLFVETEQYSARVIDIGVWSPPVLPWIKKEPNDWLPEKFGLQIGNEYILLTPEDLDPLRDGIREARENSRPFVYFDDKRIPATIEAEEALGKLIGLARPETEGGEKSQDEVAAERSSNYKHVLIVEDNFENVGFSRKIIPRSGAVPTLPDGVRTVLKEHQRSGLAWLQNAWLRGYSGVLLADDMGLGKTLQALAFLAWLREVGAPAGQSNRQRGPILIVAPTGLLANWEKEHGSHLHGPGLGDVCRAYGRHLGALKIVSARDIDRGAPALDHTRIQDAKWVLTTYETLRDYHLSFAAVPFTCLVFDEIQKVKSPVSLVTRAAKTVNANFTVGLTGTPIENQLADLWCILDIIDPGRLGDLKEFSTTYRPDDYDALERLRARLLDGDSDNPAPVLRRMKLDHIDGLPEKKIHIRTRMMPPTQAQVYGDLVVRGKQPDAGPMLEALHLLRGVSLHPIWPPAGEIKEPNSYIADSARLTETFAILDDIAKRREKVLIFLESLDLQEHLSLMIKNRYSLKRRPMQINGEIAGEKRQKLVDDFQNERGTFDVMILSPRAGGVGLTLTEANHVIHLSRWWNPAVEDQCTDRVYRIGQQKTVHVYYPMAVHPLYGDSSFDSLLHSLLARKRELSSRMLIPPVSVEQDQKWFADQLGRKRSEGTVAAADIGELDLMDPRTFERWALARCVSFGWEASGTPTSHDGGADGIILHRSSGARVVLQCKHKQASDTCGPEAVDDLLRARARYRDVSRSFVLTNAKRFSSSATDRAEKHGIKLIGRSEIIHWPEQLLQ